MDIGKNPETVSYLESVLGVEAEDQGRRPKGSKMSQSGKKSRKTRSVSHLTEVKKQDAVVPSEDPIQRTTRLRAYGDVFVPICNLEEVGWCVDRVGLGFPKRPKWRELGLKTAEALHLYEEKSFKEWLDVVNDVAHVESVSTFERNLEFWREMWRVLERGDICLVVVDARNPLLHLDREFLTYLCIMPKLFDLEGTFACCR